MEIFELSGGTKEEMVDTKYISCDGKEAQDFYNEVIAFFDKQEGYTTSRSRFGNGKAKFM